MKNVFTRFVFLTLLIALPCGGFAQNVARESERQVAVAYDVDVLVVGGTTGAVEAAVAASKAGARVFLAAPRPYLGEDVCGTMRLFLEKDAVLETELAKRILDEKNSKMADAIPSLKFKYALSETALKGSGERISLNDGITGESPAISVQFRSDVDVNVSMAAKSVVKEIVVAAFWRKGDFEPGKISVEVSGDKKSWAKAGDAAFEKPDVNGGDQLLMARVPVGREIRFARVAVSRAAGVDRLLLSEVFVVPEGEEKIESRFAGPFLPLKIKTALDAALVEAKVRFLYSCLPTDVARDGSGRVSGVVFANRAGRQLVRAKVVIDATQYATVARLAGAEFSGFPKNSVQKFEIVTMGGSLSKGAGVVSERTGLVFPTPEGNGELIIHTVDVAMRDFSWGAIAEAEQVVRDRVFDSGQRVNTEIVRMLEPPTVFPEVMSDGNEFQLEDSRPANCPEIFVLNECTVRRIGTRNDAGTLMKRGEVFGKLAAAEAGKRGEFKGVLKIDGGGLSGGVTSPAVKSGDKSPHSVRERVASGELRELSGGVRSVRCSLPEVKSEARDLPVLGEYDVVIVGGGTAGSPAAIFAAKEGMRTLQVEYQHMLGGVSTVGLITKYWHGYKKGFPEMIPDSKGYWDPRARADWLRREFRKAGGELWFGCLGNGALVEGNVVKGVVVATPLGRGVVLAKRVIDATGNADIAAAAGAETVAPGSGQLAIQGTGLPPVRLTSRDFTNTDWTIVDETDMVDVWRAQLYARLKYPTAFDTAPFIDSRERRQIVGDFAMSVMDQINKRTYPDTINLCLSNLDSHGFSVAPYLETEHPDKKVMLLVRAPYRSILPRGMENLLVIGLGMSGDHDALPVLRMQSHLQNQGMAAGIAAAMSIRGNTGLREIDMRGLQRRLVGLGSLPEEILSEVDSYPLSDSAFAEAVKTLPKDYKGASVLFTDAERAKPLLRAAYARGGDADAKLHYAHVLGLMGDAAGAATLVDFVKNEKWDAAWNYKGMGNFGSTVSRMDSIIMVLGRLGVRGELPAVLEKAALLTAGGDFSHYRAVSFALEDFRDPRAVPVLEKMLRENGGFAMTSAEAVMARVLKSPTDVTLRRDSTREVYLARALLACGDSKDGLGRKTLETYAKDVRGYWARFASEALVKYGDR